MADPGPTKTGKILCPNDRRTKKFPNPSILEPIRKPLATLPLAAVFKAFG